MRHAWGLYALALVAGIAVLHGAGGAPFWRDRMYYFMPQYEACRQAIRDGEVPLWNPYTNCGQPLHATWQAGLGSPFSLPFLLLPWDRAMPVFWLLVLPFAAAGAYALGLRAGLTPFGAAVAGVVYAGAAPLRTLGEWPNIVVGLACLPALLAAGADLVRGRPGAVPAVGLLAALQVLAGQPRQALMAAITFGLWIMVLGWRESGDGSGGPRPRRRVPVAYLLSGAGALALAVAAMQLVPTLELFAHSDRRQYGVPADTVNESFLLPPDLLTLFTARFWGTEERGFAAGRMLMPRLYFGWLGILLAARALFSGRGPAWRFAVVTIPAGLVIAASGPFFTAMMRVLGSEDAALRYLGHLVLIGWPGVCLLAGLGAQRLGPGTRGMGAAAAAAALAAVVWWTPAGRILAGAVTGAGSPWLAGHLKHLRADTLVAATTVVAAWLATRLPGRGMLPGAALLAAMALDLGWSAAGHEAKAPPGTFTRPRVIDRYGLARGRVFSPTWTVQVFDDASPKTQLDHYAARWLVLSPNVHQVFRLHNTFGYEPLCLSASRELNGAFDNDLAPVLPAIAAAGVRWILGPLPYMPAEWPVRERIAGAWGLVEVPDAKTPVRVLPARAAGIGWRELAALPDEGYATATGETWNSVVLDARSRTAALVTPTTPWYPGWRADVDGVRRPVARIGSLFLAAPVAAGRSRVRFDYVPLSFALGLFVSAVALGALAGLGACRPR